MTEPSLAEAVAAVSAAGLCRHPVRLWGRALDTSTGELTERSVFVACKDRRRIVCPACADRYQADAFHLVAAGLRGGKGVPTSVASHPACFVTLTAPSFGAVHSRPATDTEQAPCRARRGNARCAHGVAAACHLRHRPGDACLGQPLCAGCFDYEGAIVWNARVSILWQRTSVAMKRAVARRLGLSRAEQLGAFRLSYVKVVEFQRRGLVHLHVVVRADGPDGPGTPVPQWLDAAVLAGGIEEAAAHVMAPGALLGGAAAPVRWGQERVVSAVSEEDRDRVASYLAKYAVKAATEDSLLARRPDAGRRHAIGNAGNHTGELVRTAWRLGADRDLEALRLRAHAHTFGYGGHFATKSKLWSTTFRALRSARELHAREAAGGRTDLPESWRYAGRGYKSPDAQRLAEVLAEAIATRPRGVPATSPPTSPRGPHGS